MNKLFNVENLSKAEAYKLFTEFALYAPEKQSAILAFLRCKTESIDEIQGALQHFQKYSSHIVHDHEVVDICGTGGDGASTFNISTAASILMASCGALVTKHGGKGVTSLSGSQDVIQALGIQTPHTSKESLQILQKTNHVFLWAPMFNSELKKYAALRQKIGFPSIFNVIAPLLNPMQPKRCLIGVYRQDLLLKVAEILAARKVNHALVVHSDDGLDELSISSDTHVIEVQGSSLKEYTISPENFGFSCAQLSDIKGGSSAENANLICDILAGRMDGPKLDIVLLNSGAGLYVAGISSSIAEGISLAKVAIKQGKAMELLNKLRGLE